MARTIRYSQEFALYLPEASGQQVKNFEDHASQSGPLGLSNPSAHSSASFPTSQTATAPCLQENLRKYHTDHHEQQAHRMPHRLRSRWFQKYLRSMFLQLHSRRRVAGEEKHLRGLEHRDQLGGASC